MYTLYDYQEQVVTESLEILKKYKMLYLALEMRFGKSPISLSILQEQDRNQKILFVTTKSALKGVSDVLEDFDIRLQNLSLINYESLHKIDGTFDTIVLDEAHKNISKYPKPSKSRKELDRLVSSHTQIIWMSGSPSIESASKLFHQLNISPFHTFNKYKNFYHWFNGSAHYKTIKPNLPGYGVLGMTKFTGGPRPSTDYSYTVDFSAKFDPIMLRRTLEDSKMSYTNPNVHVRTMPKGPHIAGIYSEMSLHKIVHFGSESVTANSGASRISKLHQIANGSVLTDLNETILISNEKAKAMSKELSQNTAIFYKYVADKIILSEFFPEENLFQIDASSTGLDLSHYDAMAIYSLTWSGSNYTQVLSRMLNTERKERPDVFIYLTADTVDEEIFEAVSKKRDYNERFLRK